MKLTVTARIKEIAQTQERYIRIFGPPIDRIGMPWISDSDNDFGLENCRSNQKKLRHYLKSATEVLEEDEKYKFVLSGTWEAGGYLIRYNKHEELIVYLCKFVIQSSLKLFPHIVTQTEVWRSLTEAPSGLAKKVFFEILYPRYGALVSDTIHTERGKDFWISCLNTAAKKNLGIGFISSGQVMLKPSDLPINEFLKRLDTWPRGKENQERGESIQFMIFDPSYL